MDRGYPFLRHMLDGTCQGRPDDDLCFTDSTGRRFHGADYGYHFDFLDEADTVNVRRGPAPAGRPGHRGGDARGLAPRTRGWSHLAASHGIPWPVGPTRARLLRWLRPVTWHVAQVDIEDPMPLADAVQRLRGHSPEELAPDTAERHVGPDTSLGAACLAAPEVVDPDGKRWELPDVATGLTEQDADHVAWNDPRQIIADREQALATLDRYAELTADRRRLHDPALHLQWHVLSEVTHQLAHSYRHRPGWNEEWHR
ncbi:DUF6221 family protein [Actinomadura sp. HBU206391]|uniref:DUF6221 family protein n=1 Tax=Actinomadura sp. HBU206391 TaxID=2731692 RepID=UPI00164EDE0B|nr:DUF6221 family protein [Actinomadura sp. HBU206391]MBC6460283.1 hypothetical protein [Actinomadura sp. HBU206391]